VVYISTNLIGDRDEVAFENTERLEIGVYHPPSGDRTLESPPPKSTDVQAAALAQFAEIVKAGEGGIKVEEDMELVRFKKVVWNCQSLSHRLERIVVPPGGLMSLLSSVGCWASLACFVRAPLIDFLPALEHVGPSVLEFVSLAVHPSTPA
jgi:hypothetical protein